MSIDMRRISSTKHKLLFTAVAVLALLVQPMYALVASQVANAVAYEETFSWGSTWHVGTEQELRDALADATKSHITIDNDITLATSLIIGRDNVTINGADKTLTAPNLGGVWVSGGDNYAIKVYKAENVTINSLRIKGGNAAIQINGSKVRLTGNMHVSDNAFGGIEVSRGSGVTENSILTLQGNLWDEANKEAPTRPAVWVVNGQGTIDTSGLSSTLTLATHVKAGQTQYYLRHVNSGTVATNVTQAKTYASLTDAVAAAAGNDTIELNQDIVTPAMITVNKPLTIDGKGKTVTASYSFTANGVDNAVFLLSANGTTLKNLTTTNTSTGAKPHGIVAQQVTGINLDNVTLRDGRAGLIVNSSNVTVNNLTTSNNSWYGANVDDKYGLARLTVLGTSNHDEATHIFIDNRAMEATAIVSDPGKQYVRYWRGLGYGYELDRIAPSIAITVDALNPTAFDVQATDDHSVTRVDYSIWKDGTRIGIWGNNISLANPYTATVTQYCERVVPAPCAWHPFTHLTDGTYTLHATIVDVRGKATNSEPKTFVVDRTPPVLTLNDITAVQVGSDVVVTGTAEAGVTEVQAYVGTIAIGNPVPVVNGVFGFTIANLNAGTHNIRVVAQDAAGNEGTSEVKVAVVNPAPAPSPLVVNPQTPAALVSNPTDVSGTGLPPVVTATTDITSDDAASSSVLGAQTSRDGDDKSSVKQAAALPTAEGWKVFGLLWYWWLLALAAIVGLWWLIVAARRRKQAAENV